MHPTRNLEAHSRCPGAFGQRANGKLRLARPDRRATSHCRAQRNAQEKLSPGFAKLLSGGLGAQSVKEVLERSKAQLSGAVAGVMLAGLLASGGPALATDVAKVGTCLLGNCQAQLARCLADGECLENLICLQGCNGRPDEAGCQIRCGDLYQDQAIEAFNSCAVSDKKCVPQKVDKDVFPVPKEDALDENFDLSKFTGRWYITAGLNPLFDQFDCQEHYFGVPEPGKLYGKINWRINKRNNDFIERNTVQTFKQVPGSPAKLENHDNAFLHYSDDWYILASKPDQYVLIYYIGNNDAWLGYGGATVYTRAATLPEEYIPEIKEHLQTVGLKWEDFKVTDNSCKPHPPAENPLVAVEKFALEEVKLLEAGLENDLKSFGKGFTTLEQTVERELTKDEKLAEEELREAEKFLEGIEKQYAPTLLQGPFKVFQNFKLPFFTG